MANEEDFNIVARIKLQWKLIKQRKKGVTLILQKL